MINNIKKDHESAADELIDIIVKNDPKKYKSEAEVLLAAGASATKFNAMKNIFHDVAKTMLSHRYIIKGSKDLEPFVVALTNIVRLLYPKLLAC